MSEQRRITGSAWCEGEARGAVLVLSEPLSLWGGVDLCSGVICDAHHPDCGRSIAGKVLVMPSARGSSSSSSALLELVRAGVGPAAIVLGVSDPILLIGALACQFIYGRDVPIVRLSRVDMATLAQAGFVSIEARDGVARLVW